MYIDVLENFKTSTLIFYQCCHIFYQYFISDDTLIFYQYIYIFFISTDIIIIIEYQYEYQCEYQCVYHPTAQRPPRVPLAANKLSLASASSWHRPKQ
eukprot:SAG22_NODE_380_length_11402_cov_8.514154_10_plen_97_part_00